MSNEIKEWSLTREERQLPAGEGVLGRLPSGLQGSVLGGVSLSYFGCIRLKKQLINLYDYIGFHISLP